MSGLLPPGSGTPQGDLTRRLLLELHEQLQNGRGALNLSALALAENASHEEIMERLSQLHRQGLFEGMKDAPYFRITPEGQHLLWGSAAPR